MQMSAHNAVAATGFGLMEDLTEAVDKSRPEPVYRQIADWISYKITIGDWPANLRLPAEPDLAKAMGVSRSSLRKATALMTAQHLLLQVQGKGTFVRSRALEGAMDQRLRNISELFDAGRIPYSSSILEQTRVSPTAAQRKSLSIGPDEPALHIKWLIRLDQTPFLLSEIYVVGPCIDVLEHRELSLHSLYRTLEQECGTRISRSRDVFAAVAAPPEVSALLEVEPRSPTLHIQRRLYDEFNSMILCSESWSRSDLLRLSLESTRRPEDPI